MWCIFEGEEIIDDKLELSGILWLIFNGWILHVVPVWVLQIILFAKTQRLNVSKYRPDSSYLTMRRTIVISASICLLSPFLLLLCKLSCHLSVWKNGFCSSAVGSQMCWLHYHFTISGCPHFSSPAGSRINVWLNPTHLWYFNKVQLQNTAVSDSKKHWGDAIWQEV